MLQGFVFGVVGAIFAVVGHTFGGSIFSGAASKSEIVEKPSFQVRKIGALNIPVLRSGIIQGYVVVQLSYALTGPLKELPEAAIDALLQDEAFRVLYSDPSVDVKSLEKYDLKALTQTLLDGLRKRAPSEPLKEILVNEFNFVPISSFR